MMLMMARSGFMMPRGRTMHRSIQGIPQAVLARPAGRFREHDDESKLVPQSQSLFVPDAIVAGGTATVITTNPASSVRLDLPIDQRGRGYQHLASAMEAYRGRIAVLSSFGADAAVLLALVADIDRTTPVLFLQTGRHFDETLAYRRELTALLGLTDVRDIVPSDADSADPSGTLWYDDPDACCGLRKVRPLERALDGFDAWITGRKRHQAPTRVSLSYVERDAGRTKINPLLDWTVADIEAEFVRRALPRHPLVRQGYASIGCAPCTRSVARGEDLRAGRWAHTAKTECGIHRASSGR